LGTLSSELGPVAERQSPRPRVYADANVPAGLIVFMRTALGWDVLSVVDDDDLRRASDLRHYQLAQQVRRTIVTLDRDYLDDRRFPPTEGAGVLVLTAPDERGLSALLRRIDRQLFRTGEEDALALPLEGRKLHAHVNWDGDAAPEDARSLRR
jgi:predicted nuclease of predicted toxin-antitoxin system